MPSLSLDQTIRAWSSIAETIFVPHTEQKYKDLVELLDRLIDQVGELDLRNAIRSKLYLLSADVRAIAAMMCELMGMVGTNGEVQRRQVTLSSAPVSLNRPLPRSVSWLATTQIQKSHET